MLIARDVSKHSKMTIMNGECGYKVNVIKSVIMKKVYGSFDVGEGGGTRICT